MQRSAIIRTYVQASTHTGMRTYYLACHIRTVCLYVHISQIAKRTLSKNCPNVAHFGTELWTSTCLCGLKLHTVHIFFKNDPKPSVHIRLTALDAVLCVSSRWLLVLLILFPTLPWPGAYMPKIHAWWNVSFFHAYGSIYLSTQAKPFRDLC